jgi:asparagine synthase (glutamine-hydrolysing)
MCGIAGIILHNPSVRSQGEPAQLIRGMLSQIHHRGPDEAGIYADAQRGTGTVRLSIIDLSGGQQPMESDDGRYHIHFNGELFNYIELKAELEKCGVSFKSRSDTEVLLKSVLMWGTDAFRKFDGHFAISIFDRQTKEMILARDPFGEKPLFYIANDDYFAFASEVKAFRALPFFKAGLDPQALGHISRFWTVIPGESAFRGVRGLKSGHYLKLNGKTVTESRYISLPTLDARTDQAITPDTARDKLRNILTSSVERRLRSDVEVGAYLSGGLDSTIVTCLARKIAGRKLKTFSVSFDNDAYDESEHQIRVADALQTEHHALKIGNADIVDNFRDVVLSAECPIFRTAPVPMYLLSKSVQAAGIKVVLTGEGADEFFMGYDIFKETLFREAFNDYAEDADRIEAILALYPYLPHFTPEKAGQLLQYFKNYTDSSSPFFSHDLRFANGTLSSQLFHDSGERERNNDDLRQGMDDYVDGDFNSLTRLSQAQQLELATLLEGYLLSSQGDRMTSANSIEGRCPFLNLELVEFVQSLPTEMKLASGVEKKILRESFADMIPAENALRRKQPYRAPDAAPFLDNPAYMEDVLLGQLIEKSDILNRDMGRKFVRKLMNNPAGRVSPREDQAFVLMTSALILERDFAAPSPLMTDAALNMKVVINGSA